MNKERMLAVADAIEKAPDHFNMFEWVMVDGSSAMVDNFTRSAIEADFTKCGTTACVAGWAIHLFPEGVSPDDDIESAAASILGLADGQAGALFYRSDVDVDFLRLIADNPDLLI